MPGLLGKISYLFNRKEKLHALLLVVLMLGVAGLEMVGVGAIPAFVALLGDPDFPERLGVLRAAFDLFGAQTHDQRVLWASAGLITVFLVKNVCLAGYAYIQAGYVNAMRLSLATRLFRAYLSAPYTFHVQRNTAQIIHNTNSESGRVVDEGLLAALVILRELFVVVAVLALLTAIEPLVSVAMLVFIGSSSFLFFRAVRRKIAAFGRDEHFYLAKMLQSAHQGLGGVKEVKVLGRERFFLGAYVDNARAAKRVAHFKSVIFELPRLFLEVIAVFAMLVIASLFIYQGRPAQSIVPVLTLLGVAAIRFIPSATRLVNSVVSLRWGGAAIDAVYHDLVTLEASLPATENGADPAGAFRESIELRDVAYRYPKSSEWALKGVSLSISKGSAVGLVGPSGAGKTTLVDLVLGLLEPEAGQILVDGVDIRESPGSWQRQLGYIPQAIYLSDDTIRRNVAFGIPDDEIDESQVAAAVERAQLADLIERLPAGLDTLVGERGIRLSGGQRQRIGIARALYGDLPVLIMDEATSAVDNETEREIVQAIERLKGERTVIVIAHRLTTVMKCDRLFFLRDGALEASGTYAELVDENRDFRSLAAAPV